MEAVKTQAMEKFQEVIQNRHQYARDWKARTGGKVVGYLCTYVPEEVMYAAGILPVRVLGSHEVQDLTEPHIFGMYCPYCRDCLAQGLQGRYEYLDGITYAHCCVHIRQTFESWRRHVPTPFSHYLYAPPHVQRPSARIAFAAELGEFKRALEEWLGKPITDEALDEAIEIYNTNRRLLGQVYEMRKANPPPLSGAETMEMVKADIFMDRREHNQLLEQLLEELPARDSGADPGVRLMVVGSEDDDTDFLCFIESQGATVVIDDHCIGTRYFMAEVAQEPDRLQAIANRYLNKPACPIKDLAEDRLRTPHILKLAQDYDVQAAILIQQKFCDPHQYDMPIVRQMLQENGIPSLILETDVTIPVGQFHTRIEAFLETLEADIV
ncbi:MAG: 2-hydroxyacyl-CoA dehydratase [Dehalococcoidia bacterium]